MEFRNHRHHQQQDEDGLVSAFSKPPPPPPPPPAALDGSSTSSGSVPPITIFPSPAVNYKECLRNHAAARGGHVLDGCGEFMSEEDESQMKCTVCGCHRSFHRKEYSQGGDRFRTRERILPLLLPPPYPSTTSKQHQHPITSHGATYYNKLNIPPSPSGVAMGVNNNNNSGSGATTESSSEERPVAMRVMLQQQQAMALVLSKKKRHRTKFTAEQKERMVEFAERVGWRFNNQDETAVENLCRELGIRRHVLKVWMHNNKHSIKKQQQIQQQQQQEPPHLQQQQEAQLQQQQQQNQQF